MVLPEPTRSGRENLIPIIPGSVPIQRPSGNSDPYKFWSEYYRKHAEDEHEVGRLRETLRLLNQSGKFKDVHAALIGYLTHRPKNREPWMYLALALAIEEMKGKPEDMRVALNYAADAALRTHNPNDLVQVADTMFLKGSYDRIGRLLDEATAKVPHRFEPLVMSINLAQKTKDPRRMGDSIDRLLSLGWPGNDEYFRRESRSQAEKLAATLREENRAQEADALLARLPQAEARDVFIRLRWDGDADFDLIVQEPLGAQAQFTTPRTVFGGSIIKNGYGKNPEEIYVCPRGFDGEYTVRVDTIYSSSENPPTKLTLETITHEGTPQEEKQTHTLSPNASTNKPVVVTLKHGRRKTVLPFLSPAAIMESMTATPAPAKPKSKSAGPARATGASGSTAKPSKGETGTTPPQH
ncbi:MAG: tetratricopeptide repeat protein [Isosphaeraceae bacterium]